MAQRRYVDQVPLGGDTLRVGTGAAYDLLPDDFCSRIDHLESERNWITYVNATFTQRILGQPYLPAGTVRRVTVALRVASWTASSSLVPSRRECLLDVCHDRSLSTKTATPQAITPDRSLPADWHFDSFATSSLSRGRWQRRVWIED